LDPWAAGTALAIALRVPIHEAATWQRHRPETTVLYAIVREHLPAFLRHAEEHYAAPLPKYVRRAFEGYLGCGLLERRSWGLGVASG